MQHRSECNRTCTHYFEILLFQLSRNCTAHHCKFSNCDQIKHLFQHASPNCTPPHSTQTLIQYLCPNNQISRIFSCNYRCSAGIFGSTRLDLSTHWLSRLSLGNRFVFRETTGTCLAALKASTKPTFSPHLYRQEIFQCANWLAKIMTSVFQSLWGHCCDGQQITRWENIFNL